MSKSFPDSLQSGCLPALVSIIKGTIKVQSSRNHVTRIRSVLCCYLRSTCLTRSSRKFCSVSVSRLLPAMHSFSMEASRSSTCGTWLNWLKERPKYDSLCKEPSSSGSLLRLLPSSRNVCKLPVGERNATLIGKETKKLWPVKQ